MYPIRISLEARESPELQQTQQQRSSGGWGPWLGVEENSRRPDDDDQRILSACHSGAGLRGTLYSMQFLTATFAGHGVQLGYSWPPTLAGFAEAINVAVAFPDAKGSWFTSDLLSAFLFSLTNRFHQFHVILRILYYTLALLLAHIARVM